MMRIYLCFLFLRCVRTLEKFNVSFIEHGIPTLTRKLYLMPKKKVGFLHCSHTEYIRQTPDQVALSKSRWPAQRELNCIFVDIFVSFCFIWALFILLIGYFCWFILIAFVMLCGVILCMCVFLVLFSLFCSCLL